MTDTPRAQAMRHEIMICCRANSVRDDGDIWLSLIFMTEEQLAALCRELHISPSGGNNP